MGGKSVMSPVIHHHAATGAAPSSHTTLYLLLQLQMDLLSTPAQSAINILNGTGHCPYLPHHIRMGLRRDTASYYSS